MIITRYPDSRATRREPFEDRRVRSPSGNGGVIAVGRSGFAEGGSLGLQIDRRVAVRGIWTGVTQPVTDGHEIDARLQEMDGSTVAQAVGVEPLAGEARTRRASTVAGLGEDTARRIGSGVHRGD